MSETAHTPGPWRVGYSDESGNGEDGFYTIVAGDNEAVVRSGDSFGLGYGIENKADAVFIVRACNAHDDLYAELMDVLNWAVIEKAPLREQEIAHIRATLAKAEGRT